MHIIEWSTDFETGIDLVDAQHKAFCSKINDLYDLLNHSGNTSRKAVEAALTAMSTSLSEHHQTEEKLMAEYSYPGFAEHKEEHAAFAECCAKLSEDILDSITLSPLPFVAKRAAIGWFMNHILDSDRKMAEYIKAQIASLPKVSNL